MFTHADLSQGCFPEADKDPVIQIASLVSVQGQTAPAVRNVMTLDQCAPIVGAEVMSFRTEQQLLKVGSKQLQILPGHHLPHACHRMRLLSELKAFNSDGSCAVTSFIQKRYSCQVY